MLQSFGLDLKRISYLVLDHSLIPIFNNIGKNSECKINIQYCTPSNTMLMNDCKACKETNFLFVQRVKNHEDLAH